MKHSGFYSENGFLILPDMTKYEIEQVLKLVETQYVSVVREFCDSSVHPLFDYARNPPKLEHQRVWSKTNRLLPESAVKTFESLEFVDQIRKCMGDFQVTDEENIGFGNVYFRLARPGRHEDVGPPHADSWFWEISGKSTGTRFKVWIPLWPTVGSPAFRFVPSSHLFKDKFRYEVVSKHGSQKPQIVKEIPEELYHFHGSRSGVPILFHDDLIHGGVVLNEDLRISIEFTGHIK
jgi:hypothetical protein